MSIPKITPGQNSSTGAAATTTAKGKLNQIYVISKTHGSACLSTSTASNHQLIPVPIVSSFGINPKMSAETIPQMGNLNAALTVPEYTDVEVTFDIMETDLFQLQAAIQDVSPTTTQFTISPDTLLTSELTFFGNQYSEATGGIIASYVVGGVSLTSMSETQDTAKSKKIAFKGTGIIYRSNLGLAIDYARFTNSSPSYATPYDVVLTAGTTGTLNNVTATTPTGPLPNFASTTYNGYNLILLNGFPVTNNVTVTGQTFTVAASGQANAVYEIFYPVASASGNIN